MNYKDFDHCELWKNLGKAAVHTMSSVLLIFLLWIFFIPTTSVGVEMCCAVHLPIGFSLLVMCNQLPNGKSLAILNSEVHKYLNVGIKWCGLVFDNG